MYKAAADLGGVTYRVYDTSREFFMDKILLPTVRDILSPAAATYWPTSYKGD